MIALCFLILPFTYFYAEEALDSEEDMDFAFDDDYDDDEEISTQYSNGKNKKFKSRSMSSFWDRSYKAIR